MGVLHGSRNKNCTATNAKTPGLFANLEEAGNLDFVTKWKNLGHFFLSDNLEELERQTNFSINYMKHLDPNRLHQSLWENYTSNEDIYAILYFRICKNSSLPNFENYGVNCSLHDEKRDEVCANGKSHQENFDIFGVYCRKYIKKFTPKESLKKHIS